MNSDKKKCTVCNKEKTACFIDINERIICKECLTNEVVSGKWGTSFILFDNRKIDGHLPIKERFGQFKTEYSEDKKKNMEMMKRKALSLGGNAIEYNPLSEMIDGKECIVYRVFKVG